jgi:hypothetical protein
LTLLTRRREVIVASVVVIVVKLFGIIIFLHVRRARTWLSRLSMGLLALSLMRSSAPET